MAQDVLIVFGFGSLMYEPECAEALIDVVPARLPGWSRAFNKLSMARGCLASEQAFPSVAVPEVFVDGERRLSLALGTEPGDGIDGVALAYRDGAEVVRRLDLREGYDPADPHSGYLRRRVTLDGGRQATAYLTNPDSPLYRGRLRPDETARVLLHATPKAPRPARGLHYLLGVRRALARPDPALEVLVQAVAAMPGPWQALL